MQNTILFRLFLVLTVLGVGAVTVVAQPPGRDERSGGRVTAVSKDSISVQGLPEVHILGVDRYQYERTETAMFGNPLISFKTPTETIEAWKVVGRRGEYVVTGTDGTVTVVREQDQPIRTFKLALEQARAIGI